jgi:peptide/nickel transport system permease protein
MREAMGQQYISFAVSKGMPPIRIVADHALRNAMLPAVTVLGLQMGHMLGGAVVIETIFAWPGVGSLLVDSILARDIPVVQGCVLSIVGTFVAVNFAVDLIYMMIDPRIRYD